MSGRKGWGQKLCPDFMDISDLKLKLLSMFKCCGISKPDPLNPHHRGTLNVRTERPELLLVLYPMRGEIESGLVCFQQLLIKERKTIHRINILMIFNINKFFL
jgi:hypothetical protein